MITIVDELAEVVKDNEKMIYKLASSFSTSSVDDLFQVGVIGLINAYNNYNPSFGTKFSTYAYSFILGEMRKYIRENKGVKVSREISYLSSRLDRLIELLCQKYHRMPTTSELSIETGIEEWKIIEALNLRNCVRSIDEPLGNEGEITILDTISDSSNLESDVELEELLDTLDEEERSIITERYFNDRSQAEVSNMIGYSQAKVSRNEQKILSKLRSYYRAS